MFWKLLGKDWLSLRRSSFWNESVVQTIVLGFFGLFIILQLIAFGFAGGKLIEEFFPDKNPVDLINQYLIYYLLFDILIRGFIQKFPAIQLQKYLGLNIRKAQIAKYLSIKSLISFFNIAPLFFILPFAVVTVFPEVGTGMGFAWIIMFLFLILINHYLSFYIDRQFKKSGYIAFGIVAIVLISLYLDYSNFFSLATIFHPIFFFFQSNVIALPILLIVAVLLAYACYRLLYSNAYIELDSMNEQNYSAASFGLFRRFGGRLGQLMQLEAKLIWRNKRPRSYLLLSLVFILYPLTYINDDGFQSTAMMLIFGLVITGAFSLNYGQLMLSWNSNHFDFILAQNIRISDFLEAKYFLLALSNVVLFILSLGYCFFFPRMLFVNTVMFLFNTGVTIFIYLFLSLNVAKRVDLGRGSMFNYQGLSGAHFVVMIPIMILPLILYGIFRVFDLRTLGLLVVGIVGLSGIILWKQILKKAENVFYKKKYKLNANFKK